MLVGRGLLGPPIPAPRIAVPGVLEGAHAIMPVQVVPWVTHALPWLGGDGASHGLG